MSATSTARHRVTRFLRGWLWSDRWTKCATVFLVIVVLMAVLAAVVARHDPADQEIRRVLEGPSKAHWLGTDDLGRDMWARLVYGARASLLASVIAVSVGLVIGVPLGLVAGFRGGWVDAVLMRITDTLLSFPAIVLAIGIIAALGPGLTNAMVGVGVVFSPNLARITRGQVLSTKEHLYVDAATTFGSPWWRTLVRHVVPNSMRPVVVQATFLMGLAMLAEASLSYLGLGVQAPKSSWGVMLRRSARFLDRAPNHIFAPGLAIALTVVAFNTLGDSLRDALDPAASRSGRRTKRARIANDAGTSAVVESR